MYMNSGGQLGWGALVFGWLVGGPGASVVLGSILESSQHISASYSHGDRGISSVVQHTRLEMVKHTGFAVHWVLTVSLSLSVSLCLFVSLSLSRTLELSVSLSLSLPLSLTLCLSITRLRIPCV